VRLPEINFIDDKALDEDRAKGWTLVDMMKDWKVIYPFQLK